MKVVSINVKKRREMLGMKQSDLAKAAQLTQAAISNLEQGKRSCSLDVLEKIAIALSVEPATLLVPPFELLQK